MVVEQLFVFFFFFRVSASSCDTHRLTADSVFSFYFYDITFLLYIFFFTTTCCVLKKLVCAWGKK